MPKKTVTNDAKGTKATPKTAPKKKEVLTSYADEMRTRTLRALDQEIIDSQELVDASIDTDTLDSIILDTKHSASEAADRGEYTSYVSSPLPLWEGAGTFRMQAYARDEMQSRIIKAIEEATGFEVISSNAAGQKINMGQNTNGTYGINFIVSWNKS